jgi:hypothetical protein
MVVGRIAVTLEDAFEVAQEPFGTLPFPAEPEVEYQVDPAYHRSARRQSLEEELQGAAFDGTARHVWCFGGNDVEAVRTIASAAGCARPAVLPPRYTPQHGSLSVGTGRSSGNRNRSFIIVRLSLSGMSFEDIADALQFQGIGQTPQA